MPIRRVCFDAFGTLFSPRNSVYAQYTEVARQYGLQCEEARVKDGFKQAYKKWNASHPMYGKLTDPPMTPTTWWTSVTTDTFLFAGVPASELDRVSPAFITELIERFWSRRGYSLHDDVASALSALSRCLPLSPAVASGSDPGVIKVLKDLGVLHERDGGIREADIFTTWQVEKEKTSEEFWRRLLQRMNETLLIDGEKTLEAQEVLVVGDELVADYLIPRSIGMKTLLLRRASQDHNEHARASYSDTADPEDLPEAVADLHGVVAWVRNQAAT